MTTLVQIQVVFTTQDPQTGELKEQRGTRFNFAENNESCDQVPGLQNSVIMINNEGEITPAAPYGIRIYKRI